MAVGKECPEALLRRVGHELLRLWRLALAQRDRLPLRVVRVRVKSAPMLKADEHMILQFTHRPPLFPRLVTRARVLQQGPEAWGELPPQIGAWSVSNQPTRRARAGRVVRHGTWTPI